MPTYEYYCEANGRTVEVSHRMSEQLHNWGDLCQHAGLRAGKTPAQTPIQRLISGAAVLSGRTGASARRAEACEAGAACCGGGCGLPD